MKETDVVVFGAGIVGGFIFDELVLNGVKTILLEKGEDVSIGATKANSGIIHAGYDCEEGTLKAKFNVEGNKMYDEIANRIGEEIINCGSLVVGDKDSLEELNDLLNRGIKNGVDGLKILEKDELKKLEPNLSDNIFYGLYAPSAKIISPYHFCISIIEEGIVNGGKLFLNFDTKSIEKTKDGYIVKSENEEIFCKYIINACANGVNDINRLLGEKEIEIKYTKGEYILLDHSEKGFVNRPIFPLPTEKGKGILACPTVKGNIFFGPTAIDCKEYDTSVNYSSISDIKSQVSNMVNNINFKKTIKLYAGVRVKTGKDFFLEFSKQNNNYLVISGICSPGLSSAPAIAKWVVEQLKEKGLRTNKINFVKRKPYTNILKMDEKDLDLLIKKDSIYGDIVCKCETITKGEILEVLNGPISPLTTDGIKRRLRTTMGRCQGSFCYARLVNIMSDFYNKKTEEINYKANSSVAISDIKKGGIYLD